VRTVCIIQARLNSSRLNNKMLLPLLGKPMLFHVIERVKRAKLLDDVVVTVPLDDAMSFKAIFDETQVKTHLRAPGEDNDLVKAYHEAAKAYDADVVVRVPADNPCVQWQELDNLTEQIPYLSGPFDLHTSLEHHGWNHDGFGGELYSWEMLEWMYHNLHEPNYREHPHLFFRQMKRESYVGSYCWDIKPTRLDVNTQADYDKINDIYNHFGNNMFHITEVINYLDVLAERRVD